MLVLFYFTFSNHFNQRRYSWNCGLLLRSEQVDLLCEDLSTEQDVSLHRRGLGYLHRGPRRTGPGRHHCRRDRDEEEERWQCCINCYYDEINYCQAQVQSPKVQSPKVKTKGTWADTIITW